MALAVVGAGDAVTGLEFSFAFFYFGPVAIAAWYGNARLGCLMALASGLVWHFAEASAGRVYENPLAMPWNAGSRTAAFLVLSLLASKLRRELTAAEQALRTDGLTGLANRTHVIERLDHDLALMLRAGRPVVVVYFDLDDFKHVNDTLGHAGGDRVLKAVARVLEEVLRNTDTASRIGGDEFVLVLPGADGEAARSLMATVSQRIRQVAGIGCSVGAVLIERAGLSATDAIERADRLMYLAKQQGKSQIVIARCDADERPAGTPNRQVRQPPSHRVAELT